MRFALLSGSILSVFMLAMPISYAQAPQPPAAPIPGIDQTALANAARTSKIVGMSVYKGDASIGQISDILVNLHNANISAVVLSVGGFLGIGDKLVAVPSNQLNVDSEGKFTTNMTKEELTNAPADHFGK